jgi:hypothetical protein
MLALRLVIDHNTKQGAEFPWCVSRPRLDQSDCLINQAPPNPCVESMQATHSRITAERIVENSEPLQVEVFGDFFGHRRCTGGCPRIGMPRHEPC